MQTPSGAMLGAEYLVPEEERQRPTRQTRSKSYAELVARLSQQSVVKHFDAYADIPWDSPEFHIDPDDPRWELPPDDVLGGTEWYQSQPPGVRSRIGLHMMATFMKIGLQFEGVLKRGLLEFALRLPNGSPEFRYAYHEIIEEAQHSLMFQEFVNRTGYDIGGLVWWQRVGARLVIPPRARLSGAVLRLRPRRGRSHRPRAAHGAAEWPGAAPAPAPHHADPRHRGGEAPVLRAPLPPRARRAAGAVRARRAGPGRAAHPLPHDAADDAAFRADRPHLPHPPACDP